MRTPDILLTNFNNIEVEVFFTEFVLLFWGVIVLVVGKMSHQADAVYGELNPLFWETCLKVWEKEDALRGAK
jgi:hypothetical protein